MTASAKAGSPGAWALTAGAFLADVYKYQRGSVAVSAGTKADGIVVLTGGDHRVAQGLHLLEQGRAQRLLVSGVHPETSREMLRRAQHLRHGTMFSCCTDLGYQAGDTAGNAEETRDWVRRNAFKSLIVVTANYHMPRGLAELARAMPGIELIAHPVDPRSGSAVPWWSDVSLLRAMGREYVKFVRCHARMQWSHLKELAGGAAAGGTTQDAPAVKFGRI
jgi:uncharacterized SAM-binding protein YcdF (DUF218 family)